MRRRLMGVLGQALEAFKSVLLLQEEVKRLGNNTSRIAERLEAVHTSVTRLEAHQTDAIRLAQQAAQIAVVSELNDIRERLLKIEVFLASAGTSPVPPILIPTQSRSEAQSSTNP